MSVNDKKASRGKYADLEDLLFEAVADYKFDKKTDLSYTEDIKNLAQALESFAKAEHYRNL